MGEGEVGGGGEAKGGEGLYGEAITDYWTISFIPWLSLQCMY